MVKQKLINIINDLSRVEFTQTFSRNYDIRLHKLIIRVARTYYPELDTGRGFADIYRSFLLIDKKDQIWILNRCLQKVDSWFWRFKEWLY